MKKIGLLFLAVVMVLGAAGCSSDKDADPVGTWVMSYDWNCDGTNGTWVWYIRANGTFTDNNTNQGTWTVNKKDFTLSYFGGLALFSGTVNGINMSGTYTVAGSAGNGCWTANRTSTSTP